MRFASAHPRPQWEWHFLPATIERWRREGLPAGVYCPDGSTPDAPAAGIPIGEYLGLDRGQPYCQGETAYVPVHAGMLPAFEVRLLHEDERVQTVVDANGVTQQILKGVSPAMPQFLEFPVKGRDDFRRLAARYDPTTPGRYPAEWEEFVAAARTRDYPIGLVFDGFVGRIRGWMGLEGLCYALLDDPGLIEEMCVFHTEFVLQLIRRAVDEIDIDYVNLWEDMAYKGGSLISPTHVRRYLLPGYRRIVDLVRSRGIDIVFVDSDGNIEELIPIWLEAGINGVWPLEVAAGMDPVALRREYGTDLLLVGGIDKRALSQGREQVHAEVMRKVPELIAPGGYIPTVDHSVPPDVPFDNYAYYRGLLRRLAQ
jgi:uroporphyrinogen decarboxylase